MSQFSSSLAECPACGTKVPVELVHSVNADRMPELRRQIVDESFQVMTCPKCGNAFRIEPDFNYVEHGRDLWIAALPLERLPRWREEEADAEALFARVYGPRASPFMQSIGQRIDRRLTFGWAAVREKLLIADAGLDDVAVELVKSAVLRASASAPVGLGAEMRLVGADDDKLHLAWMASIDESVAQTMHASRKLYDQIAADDGGDWAALREQLSAGMFVDLNRLLVEAEPAA